MGSEGFVRSAQDEEDFPSEMRRDENGEFVGFHVSWYLGMYGIYCRRLLATREEKWWFLSLSSHLTPSPKY
jgi:hypothetical protein